MTDLPPDPGLTPDVRIPGDAAAAALFARTAVDGPPVDAAGLLAAAPLSSRSPRRRRLMMKSAALALTAAGLLTAVLLRPTPAAAVVTMQEVQAAVGAADMISFRQYEMDGAGELRPIGRVVATRDPQRTWSAMNWGEFLTDAAAGEQFYANWHTGELTVGPIVADRARDEWESVHRLFRDPATWTAAGPDDDTFWAYVRWLFGGEVRGGARNFREVTLGDTPAVGFESSVRLGDDDSWSPMSVWIDRDTRLPLRVELETGGGADDDGTGKFVSTDFTFGPAAPGAPALTLPPAVRRSLANTWAATDRLAEAGVWYVRDPAPTGARGFEDPVMTAGEGYGPLRLGMTPAEVEAATGVPAFETGPDTWWFWLPDLGVTARGTDAEGLVQIYAGRDSTQRLYWGVDPGVPMPGRTAGGVTAGMSGAEVEARLGPPDHISRSPPTAGGDRDQFVTRLYLRRRLTVSSIDDGVVQVSTYAESVVREPWFRAFVEAVIELDGEPG